MIVPNESESSDSDSDIDTEAGESTGTTGEWNQLIDMDVPLQEKFEKAIKMLEEKDQALSLAGKIGTILVDNNKRLEEEAREHKERSERCDRECRSYVHKISELEQDIQELYAKLEFMEKNVKESVLINHQLAADVQALERDKKNLTHVLMENNEINKKYELLNAKLDQSELDVQELRQLNYSLKKANDRLRSENAHLSESLQMENSRLEDENRLLLHKLSSIHNSGAINSITAAETRIRRLTIENERLGVEGGALEGVVQSMKKREREMQREHINVKAELSAMHSMMLQQHHVPADAIELHFSPLPSPPLSDSNRKSFIAELEEQVAQRVQAELKADPLTFRGRPGSNVGRAYNPSIPQTNDSEHTWRNFMQYLPWLKSLETTKQLVEQLQEHELRDLSDVLSRVVNAYNSRLVEMLCERDEICTEREFRATLIKQLRQSKQHYIQRETERMHSIQALKPHEEQARYVAEKQKELERQKELEKQREQEKIEKQKELEKQKIIEKQKELEKQKEMEKQKLVEKQKELERQKEMEKQREIDRRKDMERQKELEKQKQKDLEKQKEMERVKALEKQKEQEKQKELDKQREIDRRKELERLRELEIKKELDRQRALQSQPSPNQKKSRPFFSWSKSTG